MGDSFGSGEAAVADSKVAVVAVVAYEFGSQVGSSGGEEVVGESAGVHG